MFSIAFICTANVCRSVMAQAICAAEVKQRALSIKVQSAGILDAPGTRPTEYAWITCLQHRTPPPKKESTCISNLDWSCIDQFLVMERRHETFLIRSHGISPDRISLLGSHDPQRRGNEIEDPMNRGAPAFERCYSRIRDCVVNYLDSLPVVPSSQPGKAGTVK